MQAQRHVAPDSFPPSEQGYYAALYVAFFTVYILLACLYYAGIVRPYVEAMDVLAPRLLADSITYVSICPDVVSLEEWYWLRDAGPCLVLTALNQNIDLVTVFNVALLVGTAMALGRCYELPPVRLLLLLLINPLTFLSLFGPNKEVFGLSATMCLLVYFRQRSVLLLAMALVLSFFARSYMFAAVFLFLVASAVFTRTRPRHVRRTFYGVFGLGAVVFTIAAYFMDSAAQIVILGDVSGADDNSQSTLFSLQLEALNNKGLYLLTYVLRLLLNVYGALANVAAVSLASHGVYYAVGVIGSSLMFLILTISIFIRWGSLLKVNAQGLHIALFTVLYTLLLCISPVIQHRYFFPLYPVLVLAASTYRPSAKKSLKTRPSLPPAMMVGPVSAPRR